VAQVLHWFNVEAFYQEAHRVLRPDGVLAVWCYGWTSVSPEIDPLVKTFATETVGPYWPEDRRHIEAGYEALPFPFKRGSLAESLKRPNSTLAYIPRIWSACAPPQLWKITLGSQSSRSPA
jgi:SAM-dependent methyltransferase